MVLEQVFAASGVDRPERGALAGVQRPHGSRRAAHRGAEPAARRDAGRRPRPPRGAVVSVTTTTSRAYDVARTVTDPEMPMLTLEDLGVLRCVDGARRRRRRDDHPDLLRLPGDGHDARRPGAPAARRRVRRRRVRVELAPGVVERLDHRRRPPRWPSTASRRPGAAPAGRARSPLTLLPTRRAIACPRCGSADVELTSEFGATACKALYRCTACLEPFEHVKEI